jgi:hypothetical protein
MNSAIVLRWIFPAVLLFGGTSRGRAQTDDGLLGVAWGTGLARMRERFALVPADSDSVCTRYSSGVLQIDGASVEECILEFRGDSFAGAAALTHGADNTHRLLAHLIRLFGRGKEESPRAYQWLSENTHLFYDEDSDGDGYVYWYSRRLFVDAMPGRTTKPAHPSHLERLH